MKSRLWRIRNPDMNHRSKAPWMRLTPSVAWWRISNFESVKADAMAGLTGASIVLPQGVAFAIIAGMPPQYGLFTAIVVTIIAALWGSSRVMVSGPTTAISAVLFASLSPLAVPGSVDYVSLALTLTLMVGAIQLLAGLIGLGAVLSFVSHSVIVGFTAAAAVLIGIAQLGPALGIISDGGDVFTRLIELYQRQDEIKLSALWVSLATLASLMLVQRLGRRWPAYIFALLLGSAFAIAIDGPAKGVEMFQPLSALWPSFSMPSVQLSQIQLLLPAAAAIAFVGLLEATSIGKSFAVRRGESFDSNQEIVGQGLSNFFGSFFQCYAASGSFTRSGLNAESGARTPLSALFAAGFLAILLVLVAPFVRFVPVPAMAAIILYVAWRLINWTEIQHLVKTSRLETGVLAVTFVTGLIAGLDIAILLGCLVSLFSFLYTSARPVVATGVPVDLNGRRVFRNAQHDDLEPCPQVEMVRIEGPLFFGSIEHIDQQLQALLERGGKTLILNLKGVGRVDLAGVDYLVTLAQRLQQQGFDCHWVAASPTLLKQLSRLGGIELLGQQRIHAHKSEAIEACVKNAKEAVCQSCTVRCFRECDDKAGAVAR